MSETNYMSRGTDCHDYEGASEGSWESCSADCLADLYCIGLQRGDVGPGEDKWDHCEMIFDNSFEDCPDGEFTFYPKDCQCPPAPTPRPSCFSILGRKECESNDDDDDDDRMGRDEDWFGSDAAARGPLLVVFIGAVAAALAH